MRDGEGRGVREEEKKKERVKAEGESTWRNMVIGEKCKKV